MWLAAEVQGRLKGARNLYLRTEIMSQDPAFQTARRQGCGLWVTLVCLLTLCGANCAVIYRALALQRTIDHIRVTSVYSSNTEHLDQSIDLAVWNVVQSLIVVNLCCSLLALLFAILFWRSNLASECSALSGPFLSTDMSKRFMPAKASESSNPTTIVSSESYPPKE